MTQLVEPRSTKVYIALIRTFSIVLFSVFEGDWRFKDTGKTMIPLSLARL